MTAASNSSAGDLPGRKPFERIGVERRQVLGPKEVHHVGHVGDEGVGNTRRGRQGIERRRAVFASAEPSPRKRPTKPAMAVFRRAVARWSVGAAASWPPGRQCNCHPTAAAAGTTGQAGSQRPVVQQQQHKRQRDQHRLGQQAHGKQCGHGHVSHRARRGGGHSPGRRPAST